jgi:ribose/xylose/arabinose/galactoside ABC-type transport system permease subunit
MEFELVIIVACRPPNRTLSVVAGSTDTIGVLELDGLFTVRVNRIKVGVYMVSALTAGITAVLEVGWLGAVTTNLGQSMELAVIAAAVIGATLIEVIRNSLLLLGVDAFWQGTFVGSFIVLAVMFDKLEGSLTE